jgi:putative redox protein
MAVKVKATIGTEKYFTEVIAGVNRIVTDEPIDKGGGNKGFNPFEILASSLASCTAATLRMYIDRKSWSVPKIIVEVELDNDIQTSTVVFTRTISCEDAILDETQLKILHTIADKCPVHNMLTNTIIINTTFIEKK